MRRAPVQGFEAAQSPVQFNHPAIGWNGEPWHVVERNRGLSSTPLLGILGPRVVHNNVPKLACRQGEKVLPVIDGRRLVQKQFEVELVNQRGRLQRVVASFIL